MNQLSRKILEQMLAHSSEGIVVAAAKDPDFPVVYANPAYEHLTGASSTELQGQPLPLLNGGSLDQAEAAQLKAALARGEPYVTHLVDSCEDESNSVSQVRVEPLYGPRGAVQYIMLCQSPRSAERRGGSRVEVGVLFVHL